MLYAEGWRGGIVSQQRSQRQQFWIILTIVFLGFIGISIPYLIFPALFLNPDYSILSADWSGSSRALFLGITLAAYPLGQFIGSPILGALSDDYGRSKLLSRSLVFSAVCYLLTGLAIEWQQLGLLIGSRFAAGFMEGNIAIARAMAADIKTIPKHEAFGKINASSSVAYLLGPLLGGLMSDLSTSAPFYFICILFFGLAVLSAFVFRHAAVTIPAQVRTVWQRINFVKRLSVLFTNKRLQFFMLISTTFTLAVDIFYEFGPVHLTVKWELGPPQLILYNALLCLGLAIGNGRLPTFASTRISNRLAILGSMGGMAFFLLGVALVNSSFLMMLFFGLSGLVIGLAVTLITVKISDSAPDSIQGEVMGVQLSLRVLGDAIICLFGGALLLLSSKLILIVAALLCLGAMAYYARDK